MRAVAAVVGTLLFLLIVITTLMLVFQSTYTYYKYMAESLRIKEHKLELKQLLMSRFKVLLFEEAIESNAKNLTLNLVNMLPYLVKVTNVIVNLNITVVEGVKGRRGGPRVTNTTLVVPLQDDYTISINYLPGKPKLSISLSIYSEPRDCYNIVDNNLVLDPYCNVTINATIEVTGKDNGRIYFVEVLESSFIVYAKFGENIIVSHTIVVGKQER